MQADDVLFGINSLLIAAGLLVAMTLAMELGLRRGRKLSGQVSQTTRDQAVGAQTALIGLLALVIGFCLSMALSRFDDRSKALVEEANAIGTAWLRIDLLPPDLQPAARETTRDYYAARLADAEITLDRGVERGLKASEAMAAAERLWAIAAKASVANGGPVPLAFATAVNAMIDAFGSHEAALQRHMPGLVMRLLFVTFIGLGFVAGYCEGLAGARPSLPVYLLGGLIVLMVFLIIDLDRPRRGFVQVDRTPLYSLQDTILAPQQ